MTQSPTATETMDKHAALACRLIRNKPVLQIYFRWLAAPTTKTPPPQSPNPGVLSSIAELLSPLSKNADWGTQRESELTGQWISSICQYVAQRRNALGGQTMFRALAASMLPLYRTLATGRVREGLTQTRHRLGETLVLIGLHECLQLAELFDADLSPSVSPYRCLGQNLQLDLCNIHYLICQHLNGYNQAKDKFSFSSSTELLQYSSHNGRPAGFQFPDWACPQLLWVLSNELNSSRNEFVLPRSWIETPMPWSKIFAHWQELERVLNQVIAAHEISQTEEFSLHSSSDSASVSANGSFEPNSEAEESSIGQTLRSLDRAVAIVNAAGISIESKETMELFDQMVDGKANTNKRNDLSADSHRQAKRALSKVLIAEITNHNDPAFANIIRRQVAVCKQEDRSVCLSMIDVKADLHGEHQTLTAPSNNGLNRWQQKLVNWIGEHPEIQHPIAFLTRDGNLLLVVMDVERNAMTRILRQGLIETLTGKSDQQLGDLSNVVIPAKFHVGISSASPSANFEFEELISSAHRCLSAAGRLGNASIKSIEVY